MTGFVDSVEDRTPQLKKLAGLARFWVRKLIQLSIVESDVLLERLKLRTIHKTDHNINCVQHQLFLLSMEVDGRLLK